jgi:hypothetical protein
MDPNIKNVYLIYQGGRSDDKKICYCVSVTLVVLEELMQCEKKLIQLPLKSCTEVSVGVRLDPNSRVNVPGLDRIAISN